MTTTIRATADSLLRDALATTGRIAALADAEVTSNAVDEQRRADAIYDLADAADRVLATYRHRHPAAARPETAHGACPRSSPMNEIG